jgi:hypothetical protein
VPDFGDYVVEEGGVDLFEFGGEGHLSLNSLQTINQTRPNNTNQPIIPQKLLLQHRIHTILILQRVPLGCQLHVVVFGDFLKDVVGDVTYYFILTFAAATG